MSPRLTMMYQHFAISFALMVVYVITGKLGLMLALPPGYASAIFPPAGIAIAVTYIAGNKYLPAIFLGSLLLNSWVGYSAHQQFNLIGFQVATLIAMASVTQAWVGGQWLRRHITYPTTLDAPHEVIRFLMLSPLICLVSASISIAGLYTLGLVEQSHLLSSWASWWVGDFLGLIVMLPLTLVLLGQPSAIWKKRFGTVAFPMLITFALLIIAFITASKWERKDSLAEFDGVSNQLSEQLRIHFESQEAVLAQISALFTYHPAGNITPTDFHRFVQVTLKKYPMIYAIEWVPEVKHAERAQFVKRMEQDFARFDIKEPGKHGSWLSARKRDAYYPLTYLEPLNAITQQIQGFDLASNPERRATIMQAIRDNAAVATPPIQLYLGTGPEQGLLLMYPVKGSNAKGLVQTVLISKDFFGQLFTPYSSKLNVRLVDAASQTAVYTSLTDQTFEAVFTRTFIFGTKVYRLELSPSAQYYAQHRGWQSWGMLAVGIFCTGLMGAILLLGTGYTARMLALVDDKTLALNESASRFREITDTLGEGIYVMDRDGLITFSNPEAQRMLGWREQELLGKNAHALFHYQKADHTHYPQAECSLLNVMHSGQTFKSSDELFWTKQGTAIHIDVTSVPMFRDDQIVGAVVVFDDITSRKKTEQALRASEKSFREIIEFAPIGMTIVSLEGKFIKVNQALCNIVGYSNDELIMRTFQEITHPDDLMADLEFVELLLAGKIHSYQMEKRYIRKDKSYVWVQLSVSLFRDEDHTPQYFISQIEDITERKHQHDEVEHEANYDALTNLPNRRMLLSRLHQALAYAERQKQLMAVLFLDIDHFKKINDTLGHDAGDTILKEVALRLTNCLRQSDTVSRQGGDEFVIILPELKHMDDAALVAQKIIKHFQLPIKINGIDILVSTSIGVAVRAEQMQISVAELMKRADMAMYEAKGAGRNRYHLDTTTS